MILLCRLEQGDKSLKLTWKLEVFMSTCTRILVLSSIWSSFNPCFHLVISYLFSSCKIWNEIDFQKHASWSFCRQVKEGVYTATTKKDKIKYKSISFECFLTVSNKICLFFCNYANKTHKDASNQLISTKTVACLIENCRPHLPK